MTRLITFLPLLLLAAVVGATVPLPLDPIKVAPHIYQLDFENERVRVIRQTIRNGETQPLRAHPDRVLVYLQSCAWLEDDGEGGTRMQLFKIGERFGRRLKPEVEILQPSFRNARCCISNCNNRQHCGRSVSRDTPGSVPVQRPPVRPVGLDRYPA